MATYGRRFDMGGFGGYGGTPRGIKLLLIWNIAVFVVYFFAVQSGHDLIFRYLALVPAHVMMGAVWELFTYMFLHDPFGFWHILLNMLILWMFGKELEAVWGTKRFLQFYFICGVGAGLCVVVGNALFGNMNIPTIGASGAIYGVLLAFGMLFPDTIILFAFLFPIKAKYFVMIMGAIAFLSTFSAVGTGVSHTAHLGGMLFGYLYLKSNYSKRDILRSVEQQYRDWKLQRAKRKFQVYLRKKESGGKGNWYN